MVGVPAPAPPHGAASGLAQTESRLSVDGCRICFMRRKDTSTIVTVPNSVRLNNRRSRSCIFNTTRVQDDCATLQLIARPTVATLDAGPHSHARLRRLQGHLFALRTAIEATPKRTDLYNFIRHTGSHSRERKISNIN